MKTTDLISAIQPYVDILADRWPGLVLSTVAWSVVFGLVCVLPAISGTSFDFRNRTVSILHAFLSAYLTLVLVLLETPCEIGGPNTRNQIIVLNISTGYFIYDYVACTLNDVRKRHFDTMNFFHHLASLAGLLTGLINERSGAELGMCLFLMEVSNPFMHTIHLFRELGYNDAPVAEANKALFAIIFTLARVVGGPFLTYYTLVSPRTHWVIKAGALGILAVSFLWFSKIVAMLSKAFGGSKGKDKAGEKKKGR
ncbi:hypothetical protein NSK_002386 [Nannochloropsis salina CCMP1776]|jgi:hypothetical protein|uniref:TLC domain-containing protein n=1 Tax=Nannochloropsis salina CCMP1776 TaxID=1027361 RepID=A0A4D9DC29_9STRA|nr:hypothetical protein NSK_002386 [Nannochloropsis salina CCMP1776]|eukprot:TFJ86178.1 hypothetical protein NSK_002386 [Nannochloropsis salina CCMP1776]